LYQNVIVKINGKEIFWEVADGAIVWDMQMQPGEKDTISVQYSTWGMEGFQYKVSKPHEILDFKLVITTDCSFG
jgi:hypothetical protein